MPEKITANTLERLKDLCTEVMAFQPIDAESMKKAKYLAEAYLYASGYDVLLVKCDLENNPPDVIDRNIMVIDVFERNPQGPTNSHYPHRIML